MILKPRSLEELKRNLVEVPLEKRRVIVLVGRHPNEGTYNIALRHHEEWEKHGAVVVRIPAKWTPHYVWADAIRKGLLPFEVKSQAVPNDYHIIEELASAGHSSPVINFHCLPDDALSKFRIFTRNKREGLESKEHPSLHPNEILVEAGFYGKRKSHERKSAVRKLIRHVSLHIDENSIGHVSPRYLSDRTITKQAIEIFASRHSKPLITLIKKLAGQAH